MEETGYQAGRLKRLFDRPSSPGLTNEVVTYLYADQLLKRGGGGGIDNENIIVHHVPLDQADKWLREREAHGTLVDPKVDVGLRCIEKELIKEEI